jgi:hypothetical protein
MSGCRSRARSVLGAGVSRSEMNVQADSCSKQRGLKETEGTDAC